MKVLITGGTNGMGKGVARALAANPEVELVVLGRSERLLDETAAELSRISAPERVTCIRCDLSRFTDVRAAIDELRSRHASLDAVFVNAGLGYAPRREQTEDGLEAHLQVNYLAHFMLTLNLLDLLEASKHGGRVIFNAVGARHLTLAGAVEAVFKGGPREPSQFNHTHGSLLAFSATTRAREPAGGGLPDPARMVTDAPQHSPTTSACVPKSVTRSTRSSN